MTPQLRMVFPNGADVSSLLEHYAWPSTPWVRASMVSTVDGAGVGPDGRSGSISTPADFALFVALRNSCDVIVVGAGTARAEGYRPPRSARLAVVTRSGALDPTLPFLRDSRPEARPIILTSASGARAAANLQAMADVIACGESEVDLSAAFTTLHDRGLHKVVVEGGPSLLGDLVAADLVDEFDVQVTPLLAGGSFDGSRSAGRILSGATLIDSPRHVSLRHILTDGATLFLAYTRADSSHATRAGD